MDPIAHTLTGAALASAGLRRVTPLATATLIIAANAPDVDIVTQFAGSYTALAHRRGWTHGALALVLWPIAITAIVLLWDRGVRRRIDPARLPVRTRATLALATLGILTHPALDWLNTYGMRWLMPFDGRWFYGDAVFIVDPWIWLMLGGALFLQHSRHPAAIFAWALFGAAASYLVLATPFVPVHARIVWAVGVFALIVLRVLRERAPADLAAARDRHRPFTQGALCATAIYIGLMVGSTAAAEAEVRRALLETGEPAGDVMVGPLPAKPFARMVVAEVTRGFRFGEFHWLRSPRVRLDPALLERGSGGPVVAAASRHPDAHQFLVWSRFPFTRVQELDDGYIVSFGDARTPPWRGGGPLAGVSVRLDHALQPVAP